MWTSTTRVTSSQCQMPIDIQKHAVSNNAFTYFLLFVSSALLSSEKIWWNHWQNRLATHLTYPDIVASEGFIWYFEFCQWPKLNIFHFFSFVLRRNIFLGWKLMHKENWEWVSEWGRFSRVSTVDQNNDKIEITRPKKVQTLE